MEAFEESGYWWVPNAPESKVAGTIRFDPNSGIELQLLDILYDFYEIGGDGFSSQIVLGIIDRKLVTLCDCTEIGTHISNPGIVRSRIRALFLIEGHHFERMEDICFDEVSMQIDYLENWLQLSGFQDTLDFGENNAFSGCQVSYYPFPIRKCEHVDYTIEFLPNQSWESDRYAYRTIRQRPIIRIRAKKPEAYATLRFGICNEIVSFLTLARRKPWIVQEISASMMNSASDIVLDGVRRSFVRIGFANNMNSIRSERIEPGDFFFSFNDISSEWDKYLDNWLAKANNLRPVYDLYIGFIYRPNQPLHYTLLNLAQALESYHRCTQGGNFVEPDAFNLVKESILSAIPEGIDLDLEESIRSKIKYANEVSFRRRLKNIFRIIGKIAEFCIPDTNRFINDVVKARNYFTHYDMTHPLPIEKHSEKMFRLTQQMSFLLEMCLLHEIGFSEEIKNSIVQRNSQYTFLRGRMQRANEQNSM